MHFDQAIIHLSKSLDFILIKCRRITSFVNVLEVPTQNVRLQKYALLIINVSNFQSHYVFHFHGERVLCRYAYSSLRKQSSQIGAVCVYVGDIYAYSSLRIHLDMGCMRRVCMILTHTAHLNIFTETFGRGSLFECFLYTEMCAYSKNVISCL